MNVKEFQKLMPQSVENIILCGLKGHCMLAYFSCVSNGCLSFRECGLPEQEAVRLSLESIYLWDTLLAYNLSGTHFMWVVFRIPDDGQSSETQ
jgi:hypothetical protein